MRRARAIAAGLAVGLLALTATPAPATDESNYVGGCSIETYNDWIIGGSGDGGFTGAMYADVALFSHTHGNVVNATVTCEIQVNGETRTTFSGSGSGFVVFATPLTIDARISDVVAICTTVDYTSDPTPTSTSCIAGIPIGGVLPEVVIDISDYVLSAAVSATEAWGGAVVCPRLQALAPGSGPVSITPEGDVYIGDDPYPYYDCPPHGYENPPPPGFPPLLPPFDPDAPVKGPTGGGYDTGDAGFLALVSPETTTVRGPSSEPVEAHDVASACAFFTNGAAGTVTVTGTTVAGRQPVADTASIHCRLEDADTGAVLYDHTETANAPLAALHDTIPATSDHITVCTEGTGTWGTHVETVGPYCRPGNAI